MKYRMADVILAAALRVKSRWCMAFLLLRVKWKISVMLTISNEIRKSPQNGVNMTMALPMYEPGTTSPKPTVVSAMTMTHTDWK